MLTAADLTLDGKLKGDAIAAVQATGAMLAPALAGADQPAHRASLALIAGLCGLTEVRSQLTAQLTAEGVDGRAAAWALARLGAEAELLEAARTGRIDARDNGWYGLAVLAALGKASPAVAVAAVTGVQAEIDKAKAGGSALGEKPVRVLAILGDKAADHWAQEVIDADRYCDRFELQRLRKALADRGKDGDSISELSAEALVLFADQLVPPPAPPKPEPAAPAAKAPPRSAPAPKAMAPQSTAPAPAAPAAPVDPAEPGNDDEAALMDDPEAPAGTPVDWVAFAASPEAAALPAQVKTFAAQLGPMLEQLALRAIRAPLTDLSGQEFAALLLQVLPQALPPQHVQAALSPQAINAYHAVCKFLARTGAATHGDDLVAGVALVRKELTAQMRASGMLGGPDYSEPDEKG